MKITNETMERLVSEARNVSKNAYAPYSNFCVGVAFINADGKVYSGTNVENASYGLAICAERSAIFSSIKEGNRTIEVLVVYTPTETLTMPCGACRQVIREFSQNALIVSVCDSDQRTTKSISELLPEAFGADNLVLRSGNESDYSKPDRS